MMPLPLRKNGFCPFRPRLYAISLRLPCQENIENLPSSPSSPPTLGDFPILVFFSLKDVPMRNATPKTTGPKPPTHIAYQVQDREGQKASWQRISGAWAHTDGCGFTLQLAAMPLDGRITLRGAETKKKP
jgi:hypothetical protein